MMGWLVLPQMDSCKGDISDSICDNISGKLHAMLTGDIMFHATALCVQQLQLLFSINEEHEEDVFFVSVKSENPRGTAIE